MMNEILVLMRSWSTFAQVVFALCTAGMGTLMAVVFIGALGEFMTNGIANILHGHPYQCNCSGKNEDELSDDEEDEDEDEKEEHVKRP